MAQLNQIYGCLQTDSLAPHTVDPLCLYTPWDDQDKQRLLFKPKLSQGSLKRPRTVSVSSRMKSTRRSETTFLDKQPLKNNTFLFPLTNPRTSSSMLAQSKLSAPIIKQKKTLMNQKIDNEVQKHQSNYKASSLDPRTRMFYASESCDLFLFKPRNQNPIQTRNRNIQLIRNIHHKRFFKTNYQQTSKCQ